MQNCRNRAAWAARDETLKRMAQQFRYLAFGLQIDCAIELPELGEPRQHAGEADLTIRIGEVAHFGTERSGERDSTTWIDPRTLWLHVDKVAHYLVRQGREITIMADPDADQSSIRAYLLGSVCGAMLVQRGMLVLHGNAIRVGDACLVCVGDSGAGKSTLAAGFQKRGFEILADDVVAVDADGQAIPGFPRIKLWQDAADHLGVSTRGRNQVFPGYDKFNLPIETFDPEPRLPIRWVYLLTKGETADVQIEPIAGLRRFRLLRDNTYRNEYLDGPDMLSSHLQQCSRLAGQIRSARVVRPINGFGLDRLIDSLLADVADNPSLAGGR